MLTEVKPLHSVYDSRVHVPSPEKACASALLRICVRCLAAIGVEFCPSEQQALVGQQVLIVVSLANVVEST